MKKSKLVLGLLAVILISAWTLKSNRPTVYLIGDSTVKNGKNSGDGGLWGWGKFLPTYFDTSRISIENHAIGGRSSRTFQTEGRWDAILAKLKPGDFVIMQFGHNDGGPLADTARARGTIKGIGNESQEIFNPKTNKQEVVHTYGWYMRKYINDAKAKGAIPIVCSPVPRNKWKEGKVIRDTAAYAQWAEQVAKEEKAYFIKLNTIVCDRYDALGPDKVAAFFTSKDHTHTNEEGAKLNATCVVDGLKGIKKCPLKKYLLPDNKGK